MFWSGRLKSLSIPAAAAAAIFGAGLALGGPLTGNSTPDLAPTLQNAGSPGMSLGLTAPARQSMQEDGSAFPGGAAGFSAYHRVTVSGDSGLDKEAIDQVLLDHPNLHHPNLPSHRAGPATLLEMGANYTIANLPIKNIDGLVSQANLYYDSQG